MNNPQYVLVALLFSQQPMYMRPVSMRFVILLCLFLVPSSFSSSPAESPPPPVVSTWVFGEVPSLAWFVKNLGLGSGVARGIGFIRLAGNGAWLEITLVQRPGAWPAGKSFCSRVLPAAVRSFYAQNEWDVSHTSTVYVYNVGRPLVVGCRCYGRLMLEMGFTKINDAPLSSIAELTTFCEAEGSYLRASGGTPRLPPVVDGAVEELATSHFTTYVRPS